jgi:hypothetical protein
MPRTNSNSNLSEDSMGTDPDDDIISCEDPNTDGIVDQFAPDFEAVHPDHIITNLKLIKPEVLVRFGLKPFYKSYCSWDKLSVEQNAIMEMDRLDPAVFKKMFQLERPVIDELLEIITPHLVQRCDSKAQNSSGSAISSKTQLAVTLRWLAGASHIDLCFAWGLAHSTFFSERGVLWPTVEAIDNAFEMGFSVNDLD